MENQEKVTKKKSKMLIMIGLILAVTVIAIVFIVKGLPQTTNEMPKMAKQEISVQEESQNVAKQEISVQDETQNVEKADSEASDIVHDIYLPEDLTDSTVIEWKDANLEAKIRAQIDKPEGDITYGDVKEITELYLNFSDVDNIDDLKYMPKLERLDFSSTGVIDISVLGQLKELKELSAYGNFIADFQVISELENLTVLRIGNKKPLNFEYLMHLDQLTELLILSEIEDMNDLVALLNQNPELKRLTLHFSQLDDYSGFADYRYKDRIEFLYLAIDTTVDISDLTGFTNLQELIFWNVNITNYSGLEDMTSLKKLSFQQCSVDTNAVNEIVKMHNLTELYFSNCDLEDSSPLLDMIWLEELRIGTITYRNVNGKLIAGN